ncbi:hypothetical protein HMI55_001155 [Coelomomyces lativittatus]|nr:hypothetical protein HMI55_001155 [Coelomomyces lativittatus]
MEQRLEISVNQFNTLQKDYAKLVENRQKLEVQVRENEIVDKEFDLLEEDAQVFKLVGPVLLKQEVNESKTNVKKRLEYIRKEIERAEKLIKEAGDKLEKKKIELIELQAVMQKRKSK